MLGLFLLATGGFCFRDSALLAEDFNEVRLQAGIDAYRQQRYLEAIDQFRVAAFGLLDQPAALSEALVRLSLAQAAAGKNEDVAQTLNRFLEVERRFGVYGKAKLDPGTRSDFRALLVRSVPAATLNAIPTLSALLQAEDPKAADRQQRSAKTPSPEVIATANTQVTGVRTTPPPAPSAAAGSHSQNVLAESRRLVSAGKADEAQKALTEAIKTDPSNRDLRLALLEAACLSRAYAQGAAQLPAVMPFREGEAASMFYAAVVLYETGKQDEAREYMKNAAAKVSGPLVDEYSKKILAGP
jgi:tetratricopeptide (TPR) repeat protein